jgi:prepilin-type N-terminal cleavage/methylation domain-containing protein
VTRDEDSGFTLVESLVGMVILGIVFTAMAGFLVTAVKAQTANERRIRAAQVGNKAVEDLRALPWAVLGFYASDPGYAATYNGEETVTLAEPVAPATKDANAPKPSSTDVTVGGVAYAQTLHVTWFDDPGDGIGAADSDANTHDAKKVIADLSWTVGDGGKNLTVSGVRAPTVDEVTPRGQGVISPFQVKTFSASPATATLSSAGRTTAPITFTLTTSVSASQARLTWTDSNGLSTTGIMTAPSSNTTWTYTLPSGTGPFNTGPASFTARVYAPAGATADGTATVNFSVSSGTLDLSTPTISPSSVDLDSSGRNTQAITVTATATTSVTSMTVTYPTKTGSATSTMNLSNGNTTGTFTLAALAGSFTSGVKSWVVTAYGTTTASRAASVTFLAPVPPAVTVVGAGVSPSICAKNGTGTLLRASTVTVTVTGLNTTDTVKLEFNDKNVTTATAVYSSTNSSGQMLFTVTMASGSMAWKSVTNPSVTTTATRSSDATQTQRILTLSVYTASSSSGCPAS